jgi:hypothetical protein
LEERGFRLANALFVIDEYKPPDSGADAAALARAADRVIRGGANHTGRGRLRADGTPRPERPCRAQILTSGEDLPAGQSLRARMYTLEVVPGDIDPGKLTGCQQQAAAGIYALAMAGYLRWLASRLDTDPAALDAELTSRHLALRAKATTAGRHLRVPDMVASLAVGWSAFLDFALDVGAISDSERADLAGRVWAALAAGAAEQASTQQDADPVLVYLTAIKTALVSGNAHLTALDGTCPAHADAWGWVTDARGDILAERPQGDRIGWVDGDNVYLDPAAAYTVARRNAKAAGTELHTSEPTLRRHLRDGGYLASLDTRDGKTRATVRLPGNAARRPPVLHMAGKTLGVGEVP